MGDLKETPLSHRSLQMESHPHPQAVLYKFGKVALEDKIATGPARNCNPKKKITFLRSNLPGGMVKPMVPLTLGEPFHLLLWPGTWLHLSIFLTNRKKRRGEFGLDISMRWKAMSMGPHQPSSTPTTWPSRSQLVVGQNIGHGSFQLLFFRPKLRTHLQWGDPWPNTGPQTHLEIELHRCTERNVAQLGYSMPHILWIALGGFIILGLLVICLGFKRKY